MSEFKNNTTNKVVEFVEEKSGYAWFKVDGILDCLPIKLWEKHYVAV